MFLTNFLDYNLFAYHFKTLHTGDKIRLIQTLTVDVNAVYKHNNIDASKKITSVKFD